jgi:hypothetical protein
MEVEGSASRPGHFTPRGKSPRYPLGRKMGGPQSLSGDCGVQIHVYLLPRPYSPSLYRLSYPDPCAFKVWCLIKHRESSAFTWHAQSISRRHWPLRGHRGFLAGSVKTLPCGRYGLRLYPESSQPPFTTKLSLSLKKAKSFLNGLIPQHYHFNGEQICLVGYH